MNIGWMKSISKTENLGFHRDLENYRDLLLVLVQKEVKLRYRHKILGYLWSIANPLASAFVYFFAFKIMLKVRVEDYPLVLVAGIFPWQWFVNCVGASPRIFAGNASLIKKVRFPRNIIPLSMIINHLIHFLFSIPVIALLILLFHESISWSWIYGIPVLVVIQSLMVYGLSLIIGSINLFFRDLERIVSIVINFAFYLTPIIFTEEMIPPSYKHLIYLNPLAPLMISWRNLFLHGTINPMHLSVAFAYGVAFCILGQWVYKKLSWRFGEVI